MTYDPMQLPEYIPEDISPGELDRLTTRLANEVARLGKIVAKYELDVKAKEKAYKKEQGKAAVLHKNDGPPSLVKLIIEQNKDVVSMSDALQEAEALLIMAKAELDGRDKQYQAAKKLVDLKVQELRVFRG